VQRHVNPPKRHYLRGSFQNAGSRTTVALLLEQKQKLEIGERIKWLRDNSAEKSRTIARYCDVSDEAVRNWIAGKGIMWENAEKVAAMFGLDVDWVWRGEGKPPEGYPQEEKPPAPDLMTTLSAADSERIERIEEKLDELLRRTSPPPAEPDTGPPDEGPPGSHPPDEPIPPKRPPDEADTGEAETG
jgi:DNA-binding transcriptional regulator YiaG